MSACIIYSSAREISWRKCRRRLLAGPLAFFSLFFTAITQFSRTPLVTSPPPPVNTPPSINVSAVSVVETAPSIPVSVEMAPTSMPDVSIETAPQRILVSVENEHWYGGSYERIVPCVEGMLCEFAKKKREDADVLWHHLCSSPSQRARPDQLALIMSFESSVNYPCLEDPDHLKRFNMTMTYRLDSSLPLPSLREDHLQAFTEPVVPFEQKKDAIIFLQNNCASRSGREEFVHSLIAANFTVDRVGKCLNNAPMLGKGQNSKHDAFAQYKFCLTFENSVTPFYTSEKLWDGMSAGCLTIYKGAPNVRDYLPDAERSTLIVDDSTDFAVFANRLRSLMRDKDEYESYFVWRTRKLREQQLGYRDLVGIVRWPYHSQCMICLMAAEAKRAGRVPHWKDVLKPLPEDNDAKRNTSSLSSS